MPAAATTQVDLVFRAFADPIRLRILNVPQPGETWIRTEVFNLFKRNNFANPVGTLPNALPTRAAGTTPASNTVQPGQPYPSSAAGTFGRLTQTVGTTVGLGTNRQVQFAFRLNF